MQNLIRELEGPILVLGASGFVGANIMRTLLGFRDDVIGTSSTPEPWRLQSLVRGHLHVADLRNDLELGYLIATYQPKTVFNCLAYGAYSFQKDADHIYDVNFTLTRRLVDLLKANGCTAYIHAGSSSEYGTVSDGPREDTECWPNSHYAVTKAAASALLRFEGKHNNFPCYNLRLYSVYGPYEDASRLIPKLVERGYAGGYPPFVDPSITRDLVYVGDVVDAFIKSAYALQQPSPRLRYGMSINIGTGIAMTIKELAESTKRFYGIQTEPTFTMPPRPWDNKGAGRWRACTYAAHYINWQATTRFDAGFAQTHSWFIKNGGFGPSKDTSA